MQHSDRDAPEFDQFAATYGELLDDPLRNRFAKDHLHFHRRKWLVMQALLRRSGIDPGTKGWLDVGCGRGELLELAGDRFAESQGCDPSIGMLSGERSVKVTKQNSPVKLPFADGSMDIVTAVCIFHHVHGDERRLLMDEIARVLCPEGLCFIFEHNPWNPITRAIVGRCPVDVDAELLTARQTRQLVVESRFRVVSTDYLLFLPESVFDRAASLENVLRKVPLGGQYCVVAKNQAHGEAVPSSRRSRSAPKSR